MAKLPLLLGVWGVWVFADDDLSEAHDDDGDGEGEEGDGSVFVFFGVWEKDKRERCKAVVVVESWKMRILKVKTLRVKTRKVVS